LRFIAALAVRAVIREPSSTCYRLFLRKISGG